MTTPRRGFPSPGAGSYNSQRGFDFTAGISSKNGSWKRGENVQRFRSSAQISLKCPPPIPPPKTKRLEPNQSPGIVETTAGPGNIDHDVGPLSRYWNVRSSDQLEWVLTSKDPTCQG